MAREHKPKMITVGASAYPRVIDFARMGEIAREVGAYLLADIAHIAGMVAAGIHPSPMTHADFVTNDDAQNLARAARRIDFVPRKNCERNLIPTFFREFKAARSNTSSRRKLFVSRSVAAVVQN